LINGPNEQDKERVRALEEQLELLRGTLESTTDGILVVDERGGIVTYNQRFASLWSIPESILKSRKDEEALSYVLTQLKDPDGFIRKVRELYSKQDASSYDTIEFKDGRIFERFSQPHPGLARSLGRVWSFRDVSKRKRTENALLESEERYRSLVRQAKDALLQANIIQELFEANVFRLLVKKELIGKDLITKMRSWKHTGFQVYAGPQMTEKQDMLRVGLYIIRSPASASRLQVTQLLFKDEHRLGYQRWKSHR
jgi:PAS domain S-box-containing protein